MPATVWKGFLSFGLVTFPIRLYAAARAERVHFHWIHKKDGSRVKEVYFCAKEDKRVSKSELVKGYELGKDDYVEVEEEELKKIAPPTAKTLEIVQFVESSEVDPVFFETSYYVGPDATLTKPYGLFQQALGDSGSYAIGKVAMHNREHIVAIRAADAAHVRGAGLILHTLYYPSELHAANQKGGTSKASGSKKELELAKSLIQHLSGPFRPEAFHDTYRENVERLVKEKKKGHKVTVMPAPKKAPVIDLMEALKASLAASKSAAAGKTGSKTAKKRKAA